MADTPLELSMDEFTRQNLPYNYQLQFRLADGSWQNNLSDVKENTDYRIGFQVRNVGTETYARDVEIRVSNAYPSRIKFYKDDKYVTEVPRSNGGFSELLLPGAITPIHWVYFKLGSGPDEMRAIARVGIYAAIVPQGHYWRDVIATLD